MPQELNLNSASKKIFTNTALIAYINNFHKSKFANIITREFDHSEQGR